jgi:hypothetical protein
MFRLHGRTQWHPRPETFNKLLEAGQGVAGSPHTVAAQLRAQLEGSAFQLRRGPVRLWRPDAGHAEWRYFDGFAAGFDGIVAACFSDTGTIR